MGLRGTRTGQGVEGRWGGERRHGPGESESPRGPGGQGLPGPEALVFASLGIRAPTRAGKGPSAAWPGTPRQ